jgi:uncharacterized protein YdeI (YjbR/CyaY-like superfamily)
MNRQNHKMMNLPGFGQIPMDIIPEDLQDKLRALPQVEGEREKLSDEERKKRTKKKKAIKKMKRKNR